MTKIGQGNSCCEVWTSFKSTFGRSDKILGFLGFISPSIFPILHFENPYIWPQTLFKPYILEGKYCLADAGFLTCASLLIPFHVSSCWMGPSRPAVCFRPYFHNLWRIRDATHFFWIVYSSKWGVKNAMRVGTLQTRDTDGAPPIKALLQGIVSLLLALLFFMF